MEEGEITEFFSVCAVGDGGLCGVQRWYRGTNETFSQIANRFSFTSEALVPLVIVKLWKLAVSLTAKY